MTGREGLVRSIFIAGVFLLSIVVALFDASIAPYIWFLLFVEGRGHLVERLTARRSRSGDEGDGFAGAGAADRDALAGPHRLTAEAANRAGAARCALAERAGVAGLPAAITLRAEAQSTAVARSPPVLQETTLDPLPVAFGLRRRVRRTSAAPDDEQGDRQNDEQRGRDASSRPDYPPAVSFTAVRSAWGRLPQIGQSGSGTTGSRSTSIVRRS